MTFILILRIPLGFSLDNYVFNFQVRLCNFRVIYFHIAPSSGLFICYWAREWELACQFELSLIKLSDMEVEQWFQNNTGKNKIYIYGSI